jgi:hypothetical protein
MSAKSQQMPQTSPRFARARAFWQARVPWQRRFLTVVAVLVAWPFVMTLVYGVVPPPVS